MPSIAVALSPSLNSVLRQAAASRGRSTENVVSTAISQYLAWKGCDEANSAIRIGNIELDPRRRLVRKNSAPVRLTPTEFDLLHYLMLHAGLAMAHARILGAVWGVEYGGELEYLRTYVRHLRKKLEDDPAEPKYLLTDACYGYRFADVTVDAKGGPTQDSPLDWVAARWIDKMVSSCTIPRRVSHIEQYAGMNSSKERRSEVTANEQ